MLIGAALIELSIADAESIKAKRRVAQSIKGRVRERFNVSVSEIGDPDEHCLLTLGCVSVGTDARHLRERLEKVTRFIEGLALAEVMSEDIAVVVIDECEPAQPEGEEELARLPEEWSQE